MGAGRCDEERGALFVRGFRENERECCGLDLYEGDASACGDLRSTDLAWHFPKQRGIKIKCVPFRLLSTFLPPCTRASCSRCGALYNTAQYLFNGNSQRSGPPNMPRACQKYLSTRRNHTPFHSRHLVFFFFLHTFSHPFCLYSNPSCGPGRCKYTACINAEPVRPSLAVRSCFSHHMSHGPGTLSLLRKTVTGGFPCLLGQANSYKFRATLFSLL
jgi:hypothetical protein